MVVVVVVVVAVATAAAVESALAVDGRSCVGVAAVREAPLEPAAPANAPASIPDNPPPAPAPPVAPPPAPPAAPLARAPAVWGRDASRDRRGAIWPSNWVLRSSARAVRLAFSCFRVASSRESLSLTSALLPLLLPEGDGEDGEDEEEEDDDEEDEDDDDEEKGLAVAVAGARRPPEPASPAAVVVAAALVAASAAAVVVVVPVLAAAAASAAWWRAPMRVFAARVCDGLSEAAGIDSAGSRWS